MSTLDGGQRVGRYRIVRFLGAGAMGEVYLAEDPHIERRLAIKTVRLAGGRPQDIEDRKKRLLREARAAGRLLHPNVVTLFDTGEEDGLLYLAFEFVEGCDLAGRLEGGEPLSLREVLRIVRQVADALDYAHRQGIVHRDIKPSNILIDTAGHVKVADFGIAKVAGQNTELTVVGSVMGSPQYLSPEQIRGDELDGRSDVFSLGVVLYELLSGRRPFDGETITTLVYQILHKDASISELRAVPLRLEQLLHHMMAKDRDDRLATAGLVAEELAAIERELPEETLAAPAAPAAQVMDATRVLSSRSLPGAGSGGLGVAGMIPPGGTAAPVPPAWPAAAATGGPRPPSGAASAPVPVTAAAGAAPSGAAAAPGVRRSSNAKIWLTLAALLLVVFAAVAAGGFWVWQHYLRRAGTELGQLRPSSSSSPSATRPAPVPAAGPSAAGAGSTAPSTGVPPRQQAAGGASAAGGAAAGSAAAAGGAEPGVTQPGAASSPPPAARRVEIPPAPQTSASPPPSTAVTRRQVRTEPPPRVASDQPAAAPSGGASASSATGAAAPPDASAVAGAAGASKAPGAPATPAAGAASARAGGRAQARVADAGIGQPAAEERDAGTVTSGASSSLPTADRVIHSGLELAFRVNPPDAFVLLDGAVIGRAQEWSGLKGGRAFTLPATGSHLVKIKKPGMKDYRITVEASDMRGTTPVVVNLQPMPAAEIDTADLQTIRVREAIALRLQPEVSAVVLVDGAPAGPVKNFAGRFGHADEWLSLPPGKHRVTLVAPGYGRRDLAVEINPGADRARQKIDVTLSPATGSQ